MEEELIRRAEDLRNRCERASVPTATAYLTPAEQAALTAWNAASGSDCLMLLRGGHPACERRVAFFLPYYMDEEDFQEEEQFRALQVTAGFGQPGHRDYLGAILNLGIRRDFLGDIWVKENRAAVFCLPSVASHLLLSLDHVGRCGVRVEEVALSEVPAPDRRVRSRTFTVQSLRLDAVAAGLFGLSRASAAELIRGGAVTLNYLPCEKPDVSIREGDVLSIRGHGKATVAEVGNLSRKGRVFLRGEIYL